MSRDVVARRPIRHFSPVKVLTAFVVVVKELQRVTSKVRISYVTQRHNTFLFLFDLFSEFTCELRLFRKDVTLISFFFFSFYFQSLRSSACSGAWVNGYPRWKFLSKPIVL